MGDDAKVGAATAAPALVFTVLWLTHNGRTIGRREVTRPNLAYGNLAADHMEKRSMRVSVVNLAAKALANADVPELDGCFHLIAGFRVEGP